MISTFDLTLLGTLVSAGGLLFLLLVNWPYLGFGWLDPTADRTSMAARKRSEKTERSTMMAGARWLTVGALTLFLAYTHGADEGYLFGPWVDVMFHLALLSGCWAATAFRIKQAAERPTLETTVARTAPLPSNEAAESAATEA